MADFTLPVIVSGRSSAKNRAYPLGLKGGVVNKDLLARRASGLSATLPAPHFPAELDYGVFTFDSGFACPDILPDLGAIAAEALTVHRRESLQYSARQGQPELRAWLAEYMNAEGCNVTPENLTIVNGAKQGIDLICRLLLDEGDAIVVTAPTYFTAIPIFRSFGVEFVEVGHDEHGLLVSELERTLAQRGRNGKLPPKFLYNVPDFHNPTGSTMPRERREQLIELAGRENMLIVEDAPYRRIRFEGGSIPSLKALDRDDTVLHVGTFSKLIAPGLRIGWIAAERGIVARLIQFKSDGGTSPLIQRIVYDFCRSPAFAEHAEIVQDTYRARRDRMVAAVRRELPDAKLDVPEGGYYVWLTFPPHVDGDAFARRAAEVGVNIIPGSQFYAGAGPATRNNHVRLSYSFAAPDEIDEGVRRLAEVYEPIAA